MNEGIRAATLKDKDSVLRIHGNVYDGRDYLAQYYDAFVTAPNAKAFVTEVDGNVVGFATAFLVDDDDTVVSRAGRMHPQHSRKGLYQELKWHVLRSSGARVNAFTACDANERIFTQSFQKTNKMILSKPMTRYLVDPGSVRLTTESSTDLSLPRMSTQDDMGRYIAEEAYRRYLFPQDRVIADWVPFKLTPTNIPLMWAPNDMTVMFTDVTAEGSRGLLTIGTMFVCRDPPNAYNLEMYGTDVLSLRGHLFAHLKRMKEKASGVISLLVLVEDEFNQRALRETFNEFGLVAAEWRDSSNPELKYSRQVLFEALI